MEDGRWKDPIFYMEKMENIYFHMIFHMVFLGKKSKHMEIIWKKSILPSGKRLRDYVKSYFLMGKSTINCHFP